MLALVIAGEGKIYQLSEDGFEVSRPLEWVECPDDCGIDWTYDNGSFIEPVSNDEPAPSKQELLAGIIVTVSTGKVFDGDELSQTRMARALQIAEYTGAVKTDWKLHDNTVKSVTIAELQEALSLAMVRVGEIVL